MATVIEVANAFLSLDKHREGDGLSNLKLQKLVYYAQGFHLALFDTPLFDENIEAWLHGPVTRRLYDLAKNNGRSTITEDIPESNPSSGLTEEQLELIEEVYDVYGQYTAWRLREMTHQESPWLKNEASGGVISHDDLKSYFETQLVHQCMGKRNSRINKQRSTQPSRSTRIKPPEHGSPASDDYLIFSFARVESGDYCFNKLDKNQKAALSSTIFQRRHMTWVEVINEPKKGLGSEKIAASAIKATLPQTIPDDETLVVLRIANKTGRLVGYQQNNVFYVLWIDCKFTLYKH